MRESILDKYSRLFSDAEKHIKPNMNIFEKIKLAFDFTFEKLFYDIELIDYIQYNFYHKKNIERRKFMTHGELVKTIKKANNPELRKHFDDKALFNRDFEKYLGRSWLDSKRASSQEIRSFFEKHDIVFAKDPKGMFGKGIEVFEKGNFELSERLIENLQSKGYLLEDKLTQHSEMRGFNQSSVNSFRLVTFNTLNEGIKVMAAVMRLGRAGKHADNFHHDGIAALVDVETGIVYTRGVDNQYNRYVVHPDSKKQIVGFKVPLWEEIKELVKEAALVHPTVRYVGWDVVITEDNRLVLLEGNPGADPDITQIPDQIGKWHLYKDYIEN